ncbi:hypothetical protein CC78DRAFT_573195 [Lojkania enalia]|uniref:Uncharacterized protein n=1 Tax=Lojkania enalia TaxID=147567 RepID=A0A9P4NCY5_9PLEO|nr:hypothetical protein CC78DRAFT_573195 [Didymosphaeria enalia]
MRISPLLILSLPSSISAPVTAAPARTLCRCNIADAIAASSLHPPALETSGRLDVCSKLGSELENLRRMEPELYQAYIKKQLVEHQPNSTPTEDDMRAQTTGVMMKLAANGLGSSVEKVVRAPTGRTGERRERIICHSEPEVYPAYDDSQMTLLVLQVIVALTILACIAEGITHLTDWFEHRGHRRRYIRLSGAERRLRIQSAPGVLSSFGEKPQSDIPYLIRVGYEAKDDGEMNRPVL